MYISQVVEGPQHAQILQPAVPFVFFDAAAAMNPLLPQPLIPAIVDRPRFLDLMNDEAAPQFVAQHEDEVVVLQQI